MFFISLCGCPQIKAASLFDDLPSESDSHGVVSNNIAEWISRNSEWLALFEVEAK